MEGSTRLARESTPEEPEGTAATLKNAVLICASTRCVKDMAAAMVKPFGIPLVL